MGLNPLQPIKGDKGYRWVLIDYNQKGELNGPCNVVNKCMSHAYNEC